MSEAVRILVGDVMDGLRSLGDGSVHCAVTSPPYWGLRDYGVDGQIGLEATPEAFIEKMVQVFREVRRVLREDGTLWLNIGDSYARQGGDGPGGGNREMLHLEGMQFRNCVPPLGMKPKDLMMMPARVALALQADGWWVRSQIVWAKKSPMPESCTDRPTSAWEPIFLLTKAERYFYDAEAVKEPLAGASVKRQVYGFPNMYGRIIEANQHADARAFEDAKSYGAADAPAGANQRNVWHLGPEPYAEAHFATFPTEIPRRAIKAGTSEKGCCVKCGAPWRRVVNVSYVKSPNHGAGSQVGKAGSPHGATGMPRLSRDARTAGWQPGCSCNAGEPVPCVVLDPFLGSGTTIAVARQLGRWGVGCELNPEYAELARIRIGKAEKPLTFQDPRVKGDAPLFVGGLNA